MTRSDPASPSRRTLQHPLLDHPAVAIGVMVVLFTLGHIVAIQHRLTYQVPTMAFGEWSRTLLLDRSHLDAVIGTRAAIDIAMRFSTLLFLFDCIAVIAIARRWPRARDTAAFIGGTTWVLAAAGWRYAACMFVVAAIVHYGFRGLNSHLAMALTAAMLLIAFVYLIPNRLDFVARASHLATRASMVLGAMRLIMYAFETSSVPHKARSFLTVLAYSPLGLLLWPADPPMTSYLMYATKAPQPALDRQGSRQLYRSSLKYLVMVCLVRLMVFLLPPGSSFSAVSPGVWAIAFLIAPTVFYLRISLVADFAYGLSSFAGYHVKDAFDAPFLAENPINFWQRWDIPVMSFLRRAFIFPVSMRRRSLVRAVIAGMIGSTLLHTFIVWLYLGRRLTVDSARSSLLGQALQFGATGIILALWIPLYQPVRTRRLSVRIILLIGTQCAMGWLLFGTIGESLLRVSGLPEPVFHLFELLQNSALGSP